MPVNIEMELNFGKKNIFWYWKCQQLLNCYYSEACFLSELFTTCRNLLFLYLIFICIGRVRVSVFYIAKVVWQMAIVINTNPEKCVQIGHYVRFEWGKANRSLIATMLMP
jgi:hypothetical protein